ncbi:hypothetical protein AnigIFM59636_000744 [Aspergillus niger]|uniref:Endo-1,4-beta-xylanase n=1 Tax=Aspergillus niger ATCC 13496 TaxID=1353008 RepID=A0A370CEL3_ASPNG|nr:putative endo-1,4-beta-xylanase B precursor [Aspergillus niger CBS 101883]PYH59725.1 putative endo-1,4-beta-xylanase B precursor [Aspergillus niger CBS 101883]RDH24493.1 putative endo-1,4-beta-xylanase B precursor [Aspergillus niger ATCC 13496]GJP94015.1 endo-1,4-beta-xylanase B precursor [Aspergillus niger]GKZ97361.1 hypothetical protein AnigIFM59636_000744 [Aspergillus niger]
MPSAIRLAALSPIFAALIAPVVGQSIAPQVKSPEFFQYIRSLGNVTESHSPGDLKRSTTYTTSTSGVDSAGYYYSLYNDNGADAEYTEDSSSGKFSLSWELSTDTEFLGGKGYKDTSTRSLTWSGDFTADGDYTLAIYGWTLDPVTEWYIVESYGTGTPGNGDILGQVESDGGVYDVYSLSYDDVTEIYGVTSFKQYWSVRRVHRTTGTVDVTTHFQRWKELGLDPGSPIFQMVTLEGFEGKGSLSFTVE